MIDIVLIRRTHRVTEGLLRQTIGECALSGSTLRVGIAVRRLCGSPSGLVWYCVTENGSRVCIWENGRTECVIGRMVG